MRAAAVSGRPYSACYSIRHFPCGLSLPASPGRQSAFTGSGVARGSRRVAPARVGRIAAVKPQASSGKVKKVVLAYSGGLDTSVILKWLQDTYGCEVVTFTADLGQVSW